MKNERIWSSSFIAVCVSYFSLFVTFSVYISTLATFVVSDLKHGSNEAGLIIMVFFIGSVILRPFAGMIVDRFDKKKILVVSLIIFTILSALYIPVRNFELMLFLRLIHGMSFGAATTAMSAIAAGLVPDKRKGEGLGYFGMFLSVSVVVGPYLGLTIINSFNFNVLFAVCVAFSFLALICGCILHLPEENHNLEAVDKSYTFNPGSMFDIKTLPVAISAALMALAYSGIMTFVSLFASSIGFSTSAKYYFVIYGIAVIFSRPLGGKIFDRYGENLAVYPFIAVYIIGLIVLSTAFGPLSFYATGLFVGLGFGTLFSTLQTTAMVTSPPERRGVVSSTYFMFYDSFSGIGSYILGITASLIGYRLMYASSISFVLIATLVFYLFRHKKAKPV